MKHDVFQMAIEIKTTPGPVLKPDELQFWDVSHNHPKHLHSLLPSAPFKFYTDAILGLTYHKMTDWRHVQSEQKHFAQKAYRAFDPYTELFNKSAPRVRALRNKSVSHALHFENFEKKMTETWDQAFTKTGVSFSKLKPAIQWIADLEEQVGSPLLYNFNVHFSAQFSEKLICFYSMLFHLRSIMAVDHNAHVEDSSYEAVKCDSISDYLPKSDYTVNDALLYWNFKKLSLPFTGHKDKDARLEKLFVQPMHHYFHQFNHNACNLVDQLPSSFLNSLNVAELEEALHHVQMDWLLGSDSGLLFRVREELFGVLEGYEKIFWPESANSKAKKASKLNLCFELKEKDLSVSEAA